MNEFWVGFALAVCRGLILGLVFGACLWLLYEVVFGFLFRFGPGM